MAAFSASNLDFSASSSLRIRSSSSRWIRSNSSYSAFLAACCARIFAAIAEFVFLPFFPLADFSSGSFSVSAII